MSLSALRSSVRRVAGPSTTPLARSISVSAPLSANKKGKGKATSKKIVANPDAMPLSEAVRILRALEISNPASAVAIEITTKKEKNVSLRGRIQLPSDPRRQADVVLVFAHPDSPSAQLAAEAGANIVGAQELFPKLLSGEIAPTKVLSTPSMLPAVSKSLARFLGPKGLMPVAKRGTVGEGQDLVRMIKDVGGSVDWKADQEGLIRSLVARATFSAPSIQDNVRAFVATVNDVATSSSAAENALSRTITSPILKVRLETTHGPSIEVNDVA